MDFLHLQYDSEWAVALKDKHINDSVEATQARGDL
jgi:hypothetical protein